MPTRPTTATFEMLLRPRERSRRVATGAATGVATRAVTRRGFPTSAGLAAGLIAAVLTCGCTGPREYVHNGFKVGPNYCQPGAAVAETWIDATDKRVRTDSEDLSRWWRVFNDPVLNALVRDAYGQNLTLREAGFRVLASRAQLAITVGNIFPQSQFASGSFTQTRSARKRPTTFWVWARL